MFFTSREDKQKNTALCIDQSKTCVHAMLEQEPEITPMGNAWWGLKWIASSAVGVPSAQKHGIEQGSVRMQTVVLPLSASSWQVSLMVRILNAALEKPPTWKNLLDKNIIAFSEDYAENNQCVRPFKEIKGKSKFTILGQSREDPNLHVVTLSLPDDVHASASPDIKECLKEVLTQLDILQTQLVGAART